MVVLNYAATLASWLALVVPGNTLPPRHAEAAPLLFNCTMLYWEPANQRLEDGSWSVGGMIQDVRFC